MADELAEPVTEVDETAIVQDMDTETEVEAEVIAEPEAGRSNGLELIERRAGDMRAAVLDEKRRTVTIAVSSEQPVARSDGNEILVHDAKSINMEFLASGRAPLLLDHDHTRQIGVIESVSLGDDRVLRANVRFGKGALAQEVYTDIVDGIRSNISVGYRVNKMERSGAGDYRATKWSPLEVSVVSVPADMTVGVGRSASAAEPEPKAQPSIKEDRKMSEEVNLDEVRADAAKAAAKNASEILALATRHNKRDLADKAIADGRSIEEFRGIILDVIGDSASLSNDQDVGLTRSEVKEYSIVRALRALADPQNAQLQREAGFEREVSEAAASRAGTTARGFMVPTDVLGVWKQRDLNTSDDNELVATDLLASQFIDVLRNEASVMQAGARMIPGLVGNIAIPKKATASTAGWISTEGADSAETEPTFSQVTLSPKQLGANTQMTRQMLQQSTPAIEGIVRDDLTQAIALAIDTGALQGSGSSGQPTGVLNTAGVNTVTDFAAAVPTFAEMVSLETALAVDNALRGNLAYITDAATYGGLKTRVKDAGSGMFVLEGGEANGYRVIRSQQGTAGNVYFGNWSDLLIGMWGGLDLTIDPYTLSKSGGLNIVAFQTIDVAVRHAVSFAFGNDGA